MGETYRGRSPADSDGGRGGEGRGKRGHGGGFEVECKWYTEGRKTFVISVFGYQDDPLLTSSNKLTSFTTLSLFL